MAWSADNAATQLTTITTEQFFDDVISLNPGEIAHVQVHVALGDSAGTDPGQVSVYTTLDDSSETWDQVPIQSFYISQAGTLDDNWFSFTVSGVYKFRIGVKRVSGTSDSHTADMNSRVDGVSL
jgi:hypothetical protein